MPIVLNGNTGIDTPGLGSTGQVALTGGYVGTVVNDGPKTTGTYVPDPTGGNMKRITNGGAFTLSEPTAAGDYTMVIQITNVTGAGSIALSGFDRIAGDPLTTTVGHNFFVFITKCHTFSSVVVQALQ